MFVTMFYHIHKKCFNKCFNKYLYVCRGYLVLAVNILIFVFCAYVLFSDETVRTLHAKDTKKDQSLQSPEYFDFENGNKTSAKKHNHSETNEIYIKIQYDERSEKDGEVSLEGPTTELKTIQRMTEANNGTESEDQKVTISEPTDFPQSRLARRKSLRNHRTQTKKSIRVNSFDVRGDFNLSKDIQGDDNLFHEALLNESAADDFSVTRSRKLNHSITVAPALSRASRVNVSAYISNLISWEGSPVLSRGCRLKHLNMTSMVFVKVHKSASSTIANILARYALRYGLHVALPKKVDL